MAHHSGVENNAANSCVDCLIIILLFWLQNQIDWFFSKPKIDWITVIPNLTLMLITYNVVGTMFYKSKGIKKKNY